MAEVQLPVQCRDKIRHLLLLFVMVWCGMGESLSAQKPLPFSAGESLNYDVYYHWGIIWKRAGEGLLTVCNAEYDGAKAYKMSLAGRTLSFVDKIMRVRDTLVSYTDRNARPLYYAKITNEGSYWGNDIIRYEYDGGIVKGKSTRLRRNKPQKDTTIISLDQSYDMLSVFYYMRMIDFTL